jgi:hypothetical protein
MPEKDASLSEWRPISFGQGSAAACQERLPRRKSTKSRNFLNRYELWKGTGMRWLALTIGAAIILSAPATAAETRFERELKMLAPTERLEQICDYAAMKEIGAAHTGLRPDRAVGDAMARTIVNNDRLEAKGGAFRSHGKWYALTYICTATPDHMNVTAFEYHVGAAIPEDKWASYGLWQ